MEDTIQKAAVARRVMTVICHHKPCKTVIHKKNGYTQWGEHIYCDADCVRKEVTRKQEGGRL